MQFGVMLSVRARDVESGLHFTSSIREPSIECDVKDVIEIELDRIERRQICESIKRPAERLFLLPDETYYVIDERAAKDAVRPPDKEIAVFDDRDVDGYFDGVRSLGVRASSMMQPARPATAPR